MSSEIAEILSPEDQQDRIRDCVTQKGYLGLVSSLFTDQPGAFYINGLENAVPDSHSRFMSADYYRFLAFTAVEVAKTGFYSMGGQLDRHKSKQWHLSPFHPKHLLAVSCYAAGLNQQAYQLRLGREHYLRQNAEFDFHYYGPGIWGIMVSVVNGKIKTRSNLTWEEIKEEMCERAIEKRPICLPDLQISDTLVGLQINGDLMDSILDSEFMDSIYPKVSAIVGDLMDPEGVFVKSQFMRTWLQKSVPCDPVFQAWR